MDPYLIEHHNHCLWLWFRTAINPTWAEFQLKKGHPSSAVQGQTWGRIQYIRVVSVPRRPSLAVWAYTAKTAIWYSVKDIRPFNIVEDTLPSTTTWLKNSSKNESMEYLTRRIETEEQNISSKNMSFNILLFVPHCLFHCGGQFSLNFSGKWCAFYGVCPKVPY